MFADIVLPLYFMLPVFLSNVAANRCGGGTPVDFGGYFCDGKRIIGDGKTYRGLAGGIMVGTMVALLQPYLYPSVYDDFNSSLIFGLIITSGAVSGDMVKSFFKRRLGIERGKPFIPVDQSDFIWGALIFYYTLGKLFLKPFFFLSFQWLIVILLISPFIHFGGNIIAFKLRLKDVWW